MSYTIVIPNYNQAQFLPESIESALEQDAEVIVVDDGSTDTSKDIVHSYQWKHERLKLISQSNKGLASARNTGIMNATTEFIIFLDADDIMQPNYVDQVSKHQGDIIAPSFKAFGVSNAPVVYDAHLVVKDFTDANRIGYCAAIRREALLAVGGYSPKMTWGYEDWHLWITLLTRGYTLVTIKDILWLYRTKAQSMITEAVKHDQELKEQIRKDFPLLYETKT